MDENPICPQIGTPGQTCPSCGSEMPQLFCANCGEKYVSPEDFRFQKYLRQLFHHFTHFDSKVLITLWYLISRPGFLSLEYVRGKRVPYVRPLQLFILVNLVFFFIFGESDLFAPKMEYVYDTEMTDWSGVSIHQFVQSYASREGISVESAKVQIDHHTAQYTKGLLYLYIPILAFAFFGLFRRVYPYYACHLIFVTHWFTFMLIFLGMITPLLIALFKIKGLILLSLLLGLLIPYLFISLRRFYKQAAATVLLKALVFCVFFAVVYLIYRELILFISLHTL